MSSKPYIKLFVSDFLGDTSHLSCDEIGAYFLLLSQCWTKGFISSEDERLARLTRLTMDKWLSMKPVIMEFFKPCDDGYYNARATKELNEIFEKSTKAKHSAEVRWGKKDDANASTEDMRTHSERISERNAIPDTRYQIPDPIFQNPNLKPPLSPFQGETKKIEIEKIVPRGVGGDDQNPIKKMTRVETLRSVTEEEQGAIEKIFEHWKKLAGHPTCHLESKRTLAILGGLRLGYTVEQCLDAVEGCFKTPHNMGDNKQGANYDRLGIIFRDADHIENFIRNKKNPPKAMSGGIKSQEGLESYKKIMELIARKGTARGFGVETWYDKLTEREKFTVQKLGGIQRIGEGKIDQYKFKFLEEWGNFSEEVKKYSIAAESALKTVCETLRQFSNKNSMIFRDEKIHAVIDLLGGLAKIEFPSGDVAKFYNEFKARYDDLKDDWLSNYSPVLEGVASDEFSALVALNPKTKKVEKIDSEKIEEFKALAVQNKKRLNVRKGE
jgi:uncharacterized protein YdaU (DUF1376 family)